MIATLKFNMNDPDDRDRFNDAMNGTKNKLRLDDMWNNLFRPRHKHGYPNERLNKLLEDSETCNEVMDILEEIYRDTLREYEE